jgi:Arc/MetJ-type ribon-helix-helix transcriptional regulator
MNVALPVELERRVDESVAQGEFANRDEFFKEAAELLLDLRHGEGSPIPVDEHWDERVENLIKQAQASGEATEMSDHDWEEVERQGLALIKAKKKA